MDAEKLFNLMSGTDIRGVAVGAENELTEEVVTLVAEAFATWLKTERYISHPKIAVGYDSRVSASRIFSLVKRALLGCGADVISTGLSSTPSMFTLLKVHPSRADAAIMITASHMPADRNGLKFFTAEGGVSEDELKAILSLAGTEKRYGTGAFIYAPFMNEYSRLLVSAVESACGKKPLEGLKIVVDAGGGAGGFFADKVLAPLGADTEGSRYLKPDGSFSGHIPNPEDGVAIASLQEAVLEAKADFGVIFDADVDRAACVDASGEVINRSKLIALISAIVLEEGAGTIVTDSVTCTSLTPFIESLGGKHLRYKRGYKNVIDKCRELNESGEYSPLAIETSGHAAFKSNYYLDDGAYLITKLLIALSRQRERGESLLSFISDFNPPKEELECRLTFTEESLDFKADGAKVIDDLTKYAKQSFGAKLADQNYEGVKVIFDCGAFILRQSVHDPVLPVNIESDFVGGAVQVAKRLYWLLKDYTFLNVSALQGIIKK